MRKLIIILIFTLPFIGFSQEKISEFTTTHSNTGVGTVKMNIKFELYEDKLVFNYLDKNTIKTMKNSGMNPVLTMPYEFTKESNELSEWYKYEDDQLQIIVILTGNPKPSVSIKTKDTFTERTTEQLYFSLL